MRKNASKISDQGIKPPRFVQVVCHVRMAAMDVPKEHHGAFKELEKRILMILGCNKREHHNTLKAILGPDNYGKDPELCHQNLTKK